jgi:hypothetical protein
MEIGYALVPDLPARCGSWVIVQKSTGMAVAEVFNHRSACGWPASRFEVVSALEWLQHVNQEARK